MGIYPANAAANTFVYLLIERQLSKVVDPHGDVLACAVEIHKALQKPKDPKSLKDMITDFAKLQSDDAWNKCAQGPPIEGGFFVSISQK